MTSTTRRRYLPQFSLRFLLVVMTVVSVWLGSVVRNTTYQRDAVRAFSAIPETLITFNHQLDARSVPNLNAELSAPKWLRRAVGDDFFQTVGSVTIRDAQLDEAILRKLTYLKGLRGLAIANSTVSVGGAAQIGQLENLEWLVLTDVTFENEMLALPVGSDDLSILHIKNSSLNNAACSGLASFRKLVHLTLANVPITNAGVESIRQLDEIKELNLSRSRVTDSSLPIFAKLFALRSLVLNETSVTDSGVAALCRQRPDIQVMYDRGNRDAATEQPDSPNKPDPASEPSPID